MKKRFVSMLLALTMMVGMIPMSVFTVTAAATVIEVTSWEELEEALKASGTATIKLISDIKHKHEKYGDGHATTAINGTKNIDLNGHTVKCEDNSNIQRYMYGGHDCTDTVKNPKPMFKVSEGATVTIEDHAGNGHIRFEGAIMGNTAGPNSDQNIQGHTIRDIFSVSGTLIVNGGTIEAGRVERQWIVNGKDGTDAKFSGDYSHFDGYCRQQIWGNAVNVQTGGTLVVNGGVLQGRGQTTVHLMVGYTSNGNYICSRDNGSRASVVAIAEGAKVYINGGTLLGKGGASVFSGMNQAPTPDGSLQIRGGTFETDKHDKIRAIDSHDSWNMGPFYPVVFSGTYGNLGISKDAYLSVVDQMQFLVNGEVYTGKNEIVFLDLNQTGTWYDIAYREKPYADSFEKHDGHKMSVTIMPNTLHKEPVYLDGGKYKDYTLFDQETVRWNYGSKEALIVSAKDYDQLFSETSGMDRQEIAYRWKVTSETDSIEISHTTKDGKLDITGLLKTKGYNTVRGTLSISCEIFEQIVYSEASNTSSFDTCTFHIQPTTTPLDATSLPGNGMKVVITYPNFSGLGSDIVVNVQPTPEQLAQAQYGNSYPVYYYTYRDNDADFADEPTRSFKSTHASSWMDWGHNQVSVVMYVYGADGGSMYQEAKAWALKLPDITLTGGSWNSDKTVFTGSTGTKITLKAPIDTTNAQVSEDKIMKEDIVGWFKLSYGTDGTVAYNLLGGGAAATWSVTENGTYCYIAKDRDGNEVVSKPVKVQFSADAFSLSISKANSNSFMVNADGTTSNDLILTATGGASVQKSMIRWKVVSYPTGGESCLLSWGIVNSKTGFTKNISNFFDKSELDKIVPGDYVIQAFVSKDGATISASNQLTVNVKRGATGCDLITEDGRVVNGKTIEGPYTGKTMQLSCVPANGASDPAYTKGVTWSIETLIGTNVAIISDNGLLTAKNPGQVKVTATAKYPVTAVKTGTHVQTLIINIPITKVEVTLDTPTVGGNPDTIASVSADAPYELVYNEYSWVSGVNAGTGKFQGNLIPKLSVKITPKDGYVFPARQIYLSDYSDKTWYTYADDIVVKVNGKNYNFRDFETTYTSGSGEYGKDYDGTFWEEQSIDFYWKWDRLIDPGHTYLNYVKLTVPIPEAGDNADLAPDTQYAWMIPESANTDAIYAWVNDNGIYKVSGNDLKDDDRANDNAVKMEDGETFQKGQIYRADIYFSTTNQNNTTYFGKNVTLTINGTACPLVDLWDHENVEGLQNGKAYYYFMPTAEIQTVTDLSIADLNAPVGYQQPDSAEDITEFASNVEVGDEVYVTRLTWFYDVNNNGIIDIGEDSADIFNTDGSFIAGLRYSVYIELEARDRDDDGKSDFVKFVDHVNISIGSNQMTGDQDGAVYKFPAAEVPSKAVTTNPAKLSFKLEEGYTDRPIQKINITSVGAIKVTSVVAEAGNAALLKVQVNGMSISVQPSSTGLAKGTYASSVVIKTSDGNVLATVPVTITVSEPAANTVNVKCIGKAVTYTVSGNVVTVTNDKPCKLGYLGSDGKYVTLKGTENSNGSYSFTAPSGVTEILLGIKGDISGDGRINVGDVSKLYAHVKQTSPLSGDILFIADISGDNRINVGDVSKLYASVKQTASLNWDT